MVYILRHYLYVLKTTTIVGFTVYMKSDGCLLLLQTDRNRVPDVTLWCHLKRMCSDEVTQRFMSSPAENEKKKQNNKKPKNWRL